MPELTTSTLTVRAEEQSDALCVALFGELDLAASPPLGELLRHSIARHEYVVADLSGLDFIDSSGLEVLIEADLHARLSAARFEILRGPRHVHRAFELCGLTAELPFAD